ncbi:hypothetical protein EDC04DRAFT_2614782 [Pisolithus marmoratus]|nr:hypothetical protein EDC04DRAFT_2614782 [Pisolithus marmoratus]
MFSLHHPSISWWLLTFHGDMILLVSIGLPGRSYVCHSNYSYNTLVIPCSGGSSFNTANSGPKYHFVRQVHNSQIHVCLLAFEHSYFLMQQGSCHSWDEALVLSGNKFNASHIQQNVTKAVNVAFQQYGDNVAELCDEILKIIVENKMGSWQTIVWCGQDFQSVGPRVCNSYANPVEKVVHKGCISLPILIT